ncbi:K02A2.6-like, partial [Cordylochernes scorpioides]
MIFDDTKLVIYKKCAFIGRGNHAYCFKVQDIDSDVMYACKCSPKAVEWLRMSVELEAVRQESFDHPNILKLYSHFTDCGHYFMIMDLCDGDLFDYAVDHSYNEVQKREILRQILLGVDYLHQKGEFMHRDLKPENILVMGDCIKIADFGTLLYNREDRHGFVGTPRYASPECLLDLFYDAKSDFFSIGCVYYFLFKRNWVFKSSNFEKIRSEASEFQFRELKRVNMHDNTILANLLRYNPDERWTIAHTLEYLHQIMPEGPISLEATRRKLLWLCHIINEDGVRPDSKKLEALERCKKPFDKTSLKSFLGMLSFYSKYIPNMSTLAGPLYQLLKKDNRWKWSSQCEKAFLNLKLTLLNSQALIHYSMKLPLTLTCDASAYGISGVLCHIVEGEEKPITFVSRTLSSAEVKYSQTEKEALAIVFATSKLRQYLFGRKFVLKSDHKALTTVFGNKRLLPPLIANRLHRWALELSNFDFDIRYTNRDTMLCADAFSRLPLEEINSREDNIDLVTHDISFLNVTPLDHLIIEEETNKDPVLNKLKEYLLEDPQAVIPRTCQDQMLKLLHQSHIGINRMKSLARSSVWWPKMDSQIEEFVKECSPCMHHQTAPPAENTPWPRTNQPWQRVHVDHFYFRGDCYLLVVDANSNWIEVFPVRGTTSQENIKLLRECFARNTPTSLDKPPVERLLSYVPRTFVNCLNSEFIQKTFGRNECGRRHFQVGDKVLFTRVIQNRRKWFKAQVIRRLGYNVYLVKNLKGTFKVHVNQMRTGSDTKYAEDSDWTLDNAGAGPHRLEQDPQISTSPPPRRSTRPRCPPCRVHLFVKYSLSLSTIMSHPNSDRSLYLRKLKKKSVQLARWRCHLRFNQLCKNHNFIPPPLRIKDPVRNPFSDKLTKKFQQDLLDSRIQGCYSNIRFLSKTIKGLIFHIAQLMSTEEFTDIIMSITNDIKLGEKILIDRQQTKISFWVKKYRFPESALFGDNTPTGILNLTSVSLTEQEERMLSMGLQYIPPAKPDIPRMIAGVESVMSALNHQESLKIRHSVAQVLHRPSHRLASAHIHRPIISKLQKARFLVITKADKGNQTVLLNRSDYEEKMMNILTDSFTFTNISLQEKDAMIKSFKTSLRNMKKANLITNEQYAQFTSSLGHDAYMYGTPKIHKPGVPLRPIIAYHLFPAYLLAKFLSNLLSPIVKNNPNKYNITHPPSYIQEIAQIQPPAQHTMFSFDVTSLYLSLPHTLITDTLQSFLRTANIDKQVIALITQLTTLCLSISTFTFNHQYYKQIRGTPMGSPLSSIVSEVVMGSLDRWINQTLPSDIHYWRRYVDDIFCIAKTNKLRHILDTLHTFHADIKFTHESEIDLVLPFLDILIIRTPHKLHTTVFHKKTIPPLYTHFSSNSPIAYKINTVRTLTKRIYTHCSLPIFKTIEKSRIISLLTSAGYPRYFIDKHSFDPVAPKSTTVYRATCLLPFSPDSIAISRILRPYGIRVFYNSPPSIATLLRNPITKADKPNNPIHSTGAVYAVSCQDCPASYVGETGRTAYIRMTEHKRNINNRDPKSLIYQHILHTGHKFNLDHPKILYQHIRNKQIRNITKMAQPTGSIILHFKNKKVIGYSFNPDANVLSIPEEFQLPIYHELVFKCGKNLTSYYLEKDSNRFVKVPSKIIEIYKNRSFEDLQICVMDEEELDAKSLLTEDTFSKLITTVAEQQKLVNSLVQNLSLNQHEYAPRHVEMKAPDFSGNNLDPATWITLYENVCANNGWVKDQSKIYGMRNYLGGTAQLWFDSRLADECNFSWETWKEDFVSSFGDNPIDKYDRAFKWRYRGGSLIDYFHQKQRKMRLGMPGLSEKLLIIGVIHGLPPDMQNQLSTVKIENKETLLQLLKNIRPSLEKKPFEPKPYQTTGNTVVKKPAYFAKLDQIEEASQTMNNQNNSVPDSMLPVIINGVKLVAFLDPGSSINLMRRDLLAKYKWKSYPSETTITTIDESHVRATENIEVELQVDDQQRMMTATILREMPFELLIGKPTMRDLRIQWNFGTDEIKCLSLRSKEVIFTSDDLITIFPKLCNVSKKELPLHEIDFLLKPNNNIVACKPYPMSDHKRAWTAGKIKEMLDGDIITPSTSEYASPCILVPKTDSSYRLCIDYRQLNKETFLDPFPFPRIDSIINKFGGCRYFTKIDLKDGFWQVGLTKATRKFSAFVTPDGLYEFKRLPFGWKNSPPRFQRVMSEMLADLLELRVVVYIDDICCGAPTLEECASLTYKVLNRLNQYNMTVNLGKCQICVSEVELLGRIINGNSKQMKEEVIEKAKLMKRPYNLKSLQCFIGFTGHFRAYIPNYATIVRPLDNLKKKDSSFMWSDKCEEAYLKLIDIITSKPILAIPDESLPYEMSTDASYYGTGAILYQRDVNKRKSLQLRVISYYSYTFSKAEQNYSITEKECLAVLKAVKHFRWYLEGKSFVVHTDHRALTQLLSCGHLRDRLARWQLFLSSFEMRVNHRSGRELSDADALSRLAVETPNSSDQTVLFVKHQSIPLKLEDHGKYFVPHEHRTSILSMYHDDPLSGGHSGFWRTYYKMKQRFVWPGMKNDIRKYVSSCPICQRVKFKYKSRPSKMSLPHQSRVPFHTVHVDFAEAPSNIKDKNSTFLLLIYEATRVVQAKAMKQHGRALIKYFNEHEDLKSVRTIVSDQGRSFVYGEFPRWATSKDIRLITTSPYHPAGNGLAERAIRDIKTFLSCYPHFKGGWKNALEAAVRYHNRSYNSYLGCSPLFKLTKTSPVLPADKELNLHCPLYETEKSQIEQNLYRQRTKFYFNSRKKALPPEMNIDDYIL